MTSYLYKYRCAYRQTMMLHGHGEERGADKRTDEYTGGSLGRANHPGTQLERRGQSGGAVQCERQLDDS